MVVKLKAIFKDYLWGGKRLISDYGKNYQGEILAESWEFSCHTAGESKVEVEKNKYITLSEWFNINNGALGKNLINNESLPILIKLIDAKQSLSIQVHPDDVYGKKNEKDNGKNEMWYIIDVTDNSFIYYGFKKSITKEEYKKHIDENTLLEVMNKVYVKHGDCFFIEAGTVHAIGEGCLIAEVQQSSNITYRVYDYERRDDKGNLRELHIEKALDVSKLEPSLNIAKTEGVLIDCQYFTVEHIKCNGELKCCTDNSTFHALLILDGSGFIKDNTENTSFLKGESILIGADTGDYLVSGDFSALCTYIKHDMTV
ncbi:MAG: type I phosphomannose isomerase catalytic subunit [Oscillospiraceae bacterium]